MRQAPRVFALPTGVAFLDAFVDAFVSGTLFETNALEPSTVAAARIFVPTRRAASALLSTFATRAGHRAVLLPNVLALGDDDALAEAAFHAAQGDESGEKPTIGTLDRTLELFALVDRWRQISIDNRNDAEQGEPFVVARSRADAFALAQDLARLIDEAAIEDVPLARLASGMPETYRPERHSAYWDLTERFLRIAAEYYPQILAERALFDPVERLKARVRAFAAQLAARPPDSPVVIAGSTGSVAVTAELMEVVARLPLGAVVLPGFDVDCLDDGAWEMVGHEEADIATRYGHPQALLKRTIARIGVRRPDVRRLPVNAHHSPRERLLAEIFRPAATTARWVTTGLEPGVLAEAMQGLSLITASDEREEALAIALTFRKTLQTPDKTAALVTPDRSLARAVQAELERWGVSVEDSAGVPLARTPTAALARLLLNAALPDAGAADLLAVLRHPLARLGYVDAVRMPLVDAIEIAALRGKRLKGGITGMVRAVDLALAEQLRYPPLPRQRITHEVLEQARGLALKFVDAFARSDAMRTEAVTLRTHAAAHRALLEAVLAASPDIEPQRESAEALALNAVFETIATATNDGPTLDQTEYAAIFETMLAGSVVRPRQPGHPRLKIWGLLEARLIDADTLVLAGLDEGIWPPEMRGDPFLNRPMRIALGLQPPERRIGQTAHDFMMLLGAPDVVLTRAMKRGGTPSLASRFLRRLTAFAGAEATQAMEAKGREVLAWARAIDRPERVQPVAQPAPVVPLALMPDRLSLTEIETLYRDPYTIFARRVLRLDPLMPVDPPLDARERGTIVHEALSRFTKTYADALPEDAQNALLRFGEAAFAQVMQEDPEAVQFWWQRFAAFVPWFIDWDRQRRTQTVAVHSEISGAHDIALPGGKTVYISTRADRIETDGEAGTTIIDYKTGTPPGVNEVLRGLAPQLPLTAAFAARGAFADLGTIDLADGINLAYLHVAKARGMGEEKAISSKLQPLQDVIEAQFAALQAHLAKFATGALGYQSRRVPKSARYASDFDHLARHLEWSLGGESDESE